MSDQNVAAPAVETAAIPASEVESTTPETANESETEASTEELSANANGQSAESKDKQAAEEAKAKQASASTKKKYKLKVDGKEFEEEFDLSNEQEIIKQLQFAKVAQKRMSEHAQLRKEIDTFLDSFQKSPDAVMKQLGLDPEDFAVKLLQKKIEEDSKSPEQKEHEKLQAELKELRESKKREDEERKNNEMSRLKAEHEQKLEEGMITALESSGLPNKPLVVKKMAEVLLTALDHGLDLTPMEIIPLVKKELEDDMKEYMSSLPDEALEAFLGKDRLVGMRKKQVAAIKKIADTASSVKPTGTQKAEPKVATEKKLSMSDFLKG